jgi:hypothetical protein
MRPIDVLKTRKPIKFNVSFTPSSSTSSGVTSSVTVPVTASAIVTNGSARGSPSFAWSIPDPPTEGTASITSGAASATAQLKVQAGLHDEPVTAQFQCAVTINGITRSALVSITYTWTT